MFRVRQAKRSFQGNCGHQIPANSKFLVSQEAAQFHCAACGRKLLAEKTKALLKEFDVEG